MEQTTKSELKPCPFCGEEDISLTSELLDGYEPVITEATVYCNYCSAEVSFNEYAHNLTEEKIKEGAIYKWNTRT